MEHLVVLSGAGISAESGLKTFRGSDGLWEGHRVEDVATPEAWERNPELVLEFYNERRRALAAAQPNQAHIALAGLEKAFEVTIVTQNVDDLHEKAGSTRVIHLHGELRKSRSTKDEKLVYEIPGTDLKPGDLCEKGSQLRPHIVWFGEAVPLMEQAIEVAARADVFMVVGTSLLVYPAASLVEYVPLDSEMYVIDPHPAQLKRRANVIYFPHKASEGVPAAIARILSARSTGQSTH